jgi:phosphopantetheinyl transferase (holo-ACP synthase)
MIIWKTINDTQGKSFPFPHPQHESPSEIRRLHYANSRMALLECLRECLKEPTCLLNENPKPHDLEIKDHHYLTHSPELLVSLAHTRGLAAACVAPKDKTCLGVGIDCEHIDRPFRSELLNKFSTENDKYESELRLWCGKEAAFKASSYFWQQEKTFVLKDIIVRDKFFEIDGLLKGNLSYEFSGDYLVSIATVTHLNK